MTTRRLLFILLASATTAFLMQWNSVKAQYLKMNQLTAIACDMVSARAQAGSTRDVHDQLYSFWHKHSPTIHVDVIVKRGDKEIGSNNSLNHKNTYIQTCQIENRPDYEITFQFADTKILSLSLIEKFAAIFITILISSFLMQSLLSRIRDLWSGQVLREIRSSLGLEVDSEKKNNVLSRFLAKTFLNSASSLKPSIEKLQVSLKEKQSELTETKDLVSNLEEVRSRANQFADIVTMVRHDLKGPLSALKITASGITELPDESASLRQTINSIEQIISDLDQKEEIANTTREEILTLEIAEVAIQEVVDEKSRTLANHNGIQIDFEYNPNSLNPVKCVPNHLRRMIANLLQNAIEASPKSSLIHVGARHSQGFVMIEIADQGTGIAPEVLPKLFKRGATFGKTHGTGEGLAFVKARAESFGGDVKVVESTAKGTVFQLKLPTATTEARFMGSPTEADCNKIAVLDDEIELQKVKWSQTVGLKKYFNSHLEFLSWADNEPEFSSFSCLVDLHLKNSVTGLDVIRTLKKHDRIYLATSDYLNPEALEVSKSNGVVIIPKPLLMALKFTSD